MALIPSLKKDQVQGAAKKVFEEFEQKTGSVPEWVKVMAHCPEVLENFVGLFNAVMGGKEIESLLKWKIAYTVSQTLKCKFCIDVTEKMMEKFGATQEILEKVKNQGGETESEKETLDLIKDVTLDGHLDNPELFEKLRKKFSDAQIVEIISVMGLFNYINRFNNTLAILPE